MKDRLKVEIAPSQAAFRPNRSTTARNESDHLIVLCRNRGFDSINRNQLIEDLQTQLRPMNYTSTPHFSMFYSPQDVKTLSAKYSKPTQVDQLSLTHRWTNFH